MNLIRMTAQAAPDDWLPVAVLIGIGLAFVIGISVLSALIGPKRTGQAKGLTYESGMVPTGDARQRFNVRFYLLAIVFLVFDVEVVFLYPWAVCFPQALAEQSELAGLLLGGMVLFAGILLVAYAYAWGKGVFDWE